MSDADWRPSATMTALRRRADMLSHLRAFFSEQGVLEVETPLLSAAGNPDPHIPSFQTTPAAKTEPPRYLNTSPEFAMKRLLAAGSGPIYQVCKAFRRGEVGRHHNPEFTMLEWYRPGFDHQRLMDEVDALVRRLAEGLRELGPTERLSYREAFECHLGIDALTASGAELKACAESRGLQVSIDENDRDTWLDLLMSHCVQPQLGRQGPCFIYDYPASQAALARIRSDENPVAERFELFIDGIELANGFHELLDAVEQRARFEADLARRLTAQQELIPLDERLLKALAAGLPACAGVALGLDRLLLVLLQAERIDETIAFSYLNS